MPLSRMAQLSVAACILAGAPLFGQAPPPAADPGAAARRAAERIRALQRESDALVTQERTLLAELRKLEIDRALRVEELGEIEREMRANEEALAATTSRAEALEAAADSGRPEVEARLVRLYKMGRAGYWRLLLDAGDLRAMGRAYRAASALTRLDRERVEAHAATLASLARERQELQAKGKAIAGLKARAEEARRAAERAVAAREALIASIDERRDLNAQLTGELEAAQHRLQQTVGGLAPGGAPVRLPIRPFRGALAWPAEGFVTQRYGKQPGSSTARNGIEISLAEGQPVRAVHEGTVAFAGPFTGYGNLVILEHGDGSHSLYGHLRAVGVERGAHVAAQQPIGESGRNPGGNPALYFELRVDGKPVDPLQWLRKPL